MTVFMLYLPALKLKVEIPKLPIQCRQCLALQTVGWWLLVIGVGVVWLAFNFAINYFFVKAEDNSDFSATSKKVAIFLFGSAHETQDHVVGPAATPVIMNLTPAEDDEAARRAASCRITVLFELVTSIVAPVVVSMLFSPGCHAYG